MEQVMEQNFAQICPWAEKNKSFLLFQFCET